jgi:hypothetical protein
MDHGQIVNGKSFFILRPMLIDSDALQTAFAPSIFFDSVPKMPLNPGDMRIHTHMLINVNLVKETTLRIPTREPSKVSTSSIPFLTTGLEI